MLAVGNVVQNGASVVAGLRPAVSASSPAPSRCGGLGGCHLAARPAFPLLTDWYPRRDAGPR